MSWASPGRPTGSASPTWRRRCRAREEEQKQKEKDDAQVVDKDFAFSRLWILELDSLKAREVVTGDFMVGDPQWSPDGSRIAYTVTPTPKADDSRFADVHVLTVAGGQSRKLLDSPGPDNAPRWSPDGAWIAIHTKGPKNAGILQSKLAVVPAAGGAARVLAADFVYEPGVPIWAPDGKSLLFWSQVKTRGELFRVSVDGGAPRQISDSKGSVGYEPFFTPTASADGRTVAFTWSNLQSPDNVYVADVAGAWAPRKVSDINPQVKELALGRGEVIKWQSSEGMEIEGVLIYPADYQPGRKYPTMAFIHGGPSGVWTKASGELGQLRPRLAGQGWVVLSPTCAAPRRTARNSSSATCATGAVATTATSRPDSMSWSSAASPIPTKLGQSGWSYGGYMTAWTLTQTDRFKGVMVGAGLTNMYSMYSTNDLQTVLEEYFGGEPWNDEEAYRKASAMTFIKQAKTPSLILHGAQDQRVPGGPGPGALHGAQEERRAGGAGVLSAPGRMGIGEPRLAARQDEAGVRLLCEVGSGGAAGAGALKRATDA